MVKFPWVGRLLDWSSRNLALLGASDAGILDIINQHVYLKLIDHIHALDVVKKIIKQFVAQMRRSALSVRVKDCLPDTEWAPSVVALREYTNQQSDRRPASPSKSTNEDHSMQFE